MSLLIPEGGIQDEKGGRKEADETKEKEAERGSEESMEIFKGEGKRSEACTEKVTGKRWR